jgi:uncharacterized RDD family membrane protein YckC
MTVTARLRGRVARPAAAQAAPAADADPFANEPGVGLVTRLIAFGVDGVIINLLAALTGALVVVALSVITVPEELKTALLAVGGAAYLLWVAGYFIVFWSTTGQTPGSRLLRMRVVAADGGRILPRRALLRFVGLTLAALPFFAGYLMILVDRRRRGLQDVLARTLVIDAPREAPPSRRPPPRVP